jgi:hypothetical protein
VCIDDATGAMASIIPGVAPPGVILTQTVVASDDGSLLFALAVGPGSTASVNTVYVKTWSLSSTALLSSWSLQLPYFGNRGLYPIPGTSLVYLCAASPVSSQLLAIDGLLGTLVATIPLPGLPFGDYGKYALLRQGHFYAITTGAPSGGLLVDVDTNAHAIIGSPVFIPGGPFQPLVIAPGSTGAPSLWLSAQNAAGIPWLTEVLFPTLTVSALAPLQPGQGPLRNCEGSAGGTELVILEGLSQASVVNVVSGLVTPVLNGISAIGVLKSGSLTKAYLLLSPGGNSAVLSFPTDPVGPGIGIPLPAPGATIWDTSLISN